MAKTSNLTAGQLRIIGGQWRGRKLTFPAVKDLRPTTDRIRETVFNWLQPVIVGARCADLFAGSGALGYEALSRGADRVDMIERDATAYQQLLVNKQCLQADHCELFNQTAQQFLTNQSDPYDIIFLDPPYSANLWTEVAELLVCRSLLAKQCRIYAEFPAKTALPLLPKSWQLMRDKNTGDVRYCLFVVE